MDKRYQVFVSSTYVDLRDARDIVFRTLMEMDCIPAGMELFPAIDEEAWQFIKRVIDDCDYYLIIMGARYGSLSADGISFTEKEYDYAVSIGLKVLAFVHKDPENLPAKLADGDPQLKEKLETFRQKVSTGRLVHFWDTPAELPGLVALSLTKTIKLYPAVGWVRGDKVSSESAVREQNALLKENEELKEKLRQLSENKVATDLAGLDEAIAINLSWVIWHQRQKFEYAETIEVTWRQLFAIISPDLQGMPSDAAVKLAVDAGLLRLKRPDHKNTVSVHPEHFKTIRIQLIALGLFKVTYSQTNKGGMALFWRLTDAGTRMMLNSRTVKSIENEAGSA